MLKITPYYQMVYDADEVEPVDAICGDDEDEEDDSDYEPNVEIVELFVSFNFFPTSVDF
jgi:hypothetical protein